MRSSKLAAAPFAALLEPTETVEARCELDAADSPSGGEVKVGTRA